MVVRRTTGALRLSPKLLLWIGNDTLNGTIHPLVHCRRLGQSNRQEGLFQLHQRVCGGIMTMWNNPQRLFLVVQCAIQKEEKKRERETRVGTKRVCVSTRCSLVSLSLVCTLGLASGLCCASHLCCLAFFVALSLTVLCVCLVGFVVNRHGALRGSISLVPPPFWTTQTTKHEGNNNT